MHLHIGFHFSGVPNAVKHDEVDVCLFEEFTGTLKLRRVSIRRSAYDLNMAYIFVPFVLALLFLLLLGRDNCDSGMRRERRNDTVKNLAWKHQRNIAVKCGKAAGAKEQDQFDAPSLQFVNT